MDVESAKLLAEHLAGNDDAAAEIYNRYVRRLTALAQSYLSPKLQARFDPEDVVQSAYRSFFRKADNHELTLRRSGDLWRLLAAFTVNKARGRVEREQAKMRDPRSESDGAFRLEAIQAEPTADEAVLLVDQLTRFMDGLNPRDRRILELRLQGESIDAISNELASASAFQPVSSATIRRVLRNARTELERQLSAR